jgi:acyl-[acyl-carrier-protein]-phospholipid O-acyltransferase / long-chain-fatty-acid--[acyl-carrier-protein] ligase
MSSRTAVEVTSPMDVGSPAASFKLPSHWKSLSAAFVHRARERANKVAIVDSTGASLTYSDTFLRAVALGRVLAREAGAARHVGVMVPPTAPGAIVNIALELWGKIPVNLNYTAGADVVDSSIDQCGVTHVITSRRALDKFKLRPKGELVHLEDAAKKVTKLDKLFAATVAKAAPISLMPWFLPGLRKNRLNEPATVIFTSGSTGDPKGVVLTQENVLSNIEQIHQYVPLSPDEVVLGVLPFFHSFGFTVTLWTVLNLGFKGVYHFNPLDARIVGNLCQEHEVTILFASPTFMRGYVQRCDKEQFTTVRLPVLGAEKLKPELMRDAKEKLGIDVLEGYGCTETGPVVAVNIPYDKKTADGRTVMAIRPGTVGMPLPGTMIKTVDVESGADLPRGGVGLVHVKGPQVMAGYLNRVEATAAVLKGGWYNTGDLGCVDEDGFLTITDRLSRFSKIGGEMVPHLKVEAAIVEATAAAENAVAVTAVPDAKRGERLVVVYTDLGAEPAEVHRRLTSGSLPKLWVPGSEDFVKVDILPLLGSGKLDLRRLREIAREGRSA